MSRIIITIHDFINYSISGLTLDNIKQIQNATGILEKGAFMNAAFKHGVWNGKTAFINEDGVGMVRNLPQVIDTMIDLGIDLSDADFNDKSSPKLLELPPIGRDWLKDETGYDLRDYQEEGINSVIDLTYTANGEGGILKLPTNGGKTIISLGISKAFDGHLKTLIIVPSASLVEQTYEDYVKSDLLTSRMLSKMSTIQRENAVKSYNHIIITASLFLNECELFKDEEWVLIYDEAHLFGDKMSYAIRSSLGHCQYRIGLTATMPGDKGDHFKDALIRHHFGDNLVEMEQSDLISRGISSDITIDCINISTPIDTISMVGGGDWVWEKELEYYNKNAIRYRALLEQIKEELGGNTLILCSPDIGVALSEAMGVHLVKEDVPTDTRRGWYAEFEDATDYTLYATYGCASTGLSINNIQTLMLLEIGKDRTRIMQSIGRGLRLDGVTNHIRVVDISSNTKYARQHRRERHKIYKREGFEFSIIKEINAER